jgi:hypothetical protein
MKKTTFTLLLMLLCAGSLFLASCAGNKEKIPALLERKKPMGPENERIAIKTTYDKAK